MHLVNLTPHAISIRRADGATLALPASGQVARCAQQSIPVITLAGIDVTVQRFGPVEGLPAPAPETRYIVSRLVAEACPERRDLLIPGPALRDEAGRIVACDGLSVVEPALPAHLRRAVADAAEHFHASGADMSDAAWHLGSCLLALRALGVPVPELAEPHPATVPPAVAMSHAAEVEAAYEQGAAGR